ncbi:MAG: BspA family leucine-rich repeat surface protein, partial [Lactobacillus sp.]|nr:BspA family leucine-rich repeat surface protein [Lactobacillus sp.]
MSGMFNGDVNLTQLDLSKFNTSKVTNMNAMFSDCPKLTSIKGLDKFDTSKVTSMGQMFAYCSSLNELDLSNFNTSKVAQFYFMFYRCTNLQKLNISSFDMTHANFNFNMFASLPNLHNLVLGKKCVMANTGLDTPGSWEDANGNMWTSDELMANYNGSTDYGLYTNYGTK